MREKIRVLEVVATLKPAGAEHIAVALASGLNPDRFDVAVVSLFNPFPGGLEPLLDKLHIPVLHLRKHAGPDLRMYSRLRQVVSEFQPHVIHTHCYASRYAIHLRAPVRVHTLHNIASLETGPVGRALNRYAFHRGVVPVAVGSAVAASVSTAYGVKDPICIPNGIDPARFQRPVDALAWRKRNRFREDAILIISVARLDRQKNPSALVRAIENRSNVHLLLVGQGELRTELEGHPRVHLLGLRNDIPELLGAADIFALASSWEGLPLAVLEAMAAGLPVLATNVGCLPEVVEHGRTGLLVEPGDHAALSAALTSLAADPMQRRSMGNAGRIRAESFSQRAMVRGYERLFVNLLDPKTMATSPNQQQPATDS